MSDDGTEDHYAVLGVTDDATAAEVRAAYVRAARRHHPDRHRDAAPDVVAEADRRMRRINDAWAVLGRPEARHAYDAARAEAREQRRRAEEVRRASVPDPGPPPADGGGFVVSRRTAWALRHGPWIAIAVLAVALLAFTSQQTGDPAGRDVDVGSCITISGPGGFETSSCDGRHDGRILAIVDRPQACDDTPDVTQVFDPRSSDAFYCLGPPAG